MPLPRIGATNSFLVAEWSDGTMGSEICEIGYFNFTDWIHGIGRSRVWLVNLCGGCVCLGFSLEFMTFSLSIAKGFVISLLLVIDSLLLVIGYLDPRGSNGSF